MALEKAFDDALKALRTSGGLVTVVLGTGVDAPTDWSLHPRVHWVVANELHRHDVPGAIPTNTKLMLITDNISGNVFQQIHDERKRRRMPYMIRKTGEAVAEALKDIFPTKVDIPFNPALEAVNGNGHGAAAAPAEDGERKPMAKGAVKTFVETNLDLSPEKTNAEEARRIFRLAQVHGIETTIGSVQQAITNYKRQQRAGSRPESLAPVHVIDSIAIAKALEDAIGVLSSVKARVEAMDAENEKLRKETDDMRTRIGLMRDAFQGL